MKVIDLKDRTIFVDDIIQLYIEEKYSPERYNIQTTNGTYLVYKEDYFKVKDYLLSLNDELGNNTNKIQELEKEKAHIEIAYEEDYKEQQQEIERLNNIIKEVREYIELGMNFDSLGVARTKKKLLEIIEGSNKE